MISYHAQYISSHILGIITYHNLCVRLIFHTRVFHSKHNYLTYHVISVFYKSVYKNLKRNSDSDSYFRLLLFYVFTGIAKPVIVIISISSVHVYIQNISFFVSVIFHIPMTLVVPWWDLNYLAYDLVPILMCAYDFLILYNFHVASYSTITHCAIELQYGICISLFNTLQFSYCVIFKNNTSYGLLN